jgi:hypothetical protein
MGTVSKPSGRASALSILALDELWRVREECQLAIGIHREEAADNDAGAVARSAEARPAVAVERVEPVIDGDLFASLDRSPREHIDAVPHRAGITRMVQVTAWRAQYREAIEAELAEMNAVRVRKRVEFVFGHDPSVPSPKDELTFGEVACGEHAAALRPRISYLDVINHSVTIELVRP